MAAKEKKPYYIEPKVFKESLQKYYDTDILTDDLAENIKKSKYIEISNGKHLCNIECADEFNKTIELFVEQNYDEA